MKFSLVILVGFLAIHSIANAQAIQVTTNILNQEIIPVHFVEYGVQISVKALEDTIYYNYSAKEDFKIVFHDIKGKCYMERYIYGKLYEKGNYENSLDTLKKYVSGRSQNGQSSPIKVIRFYQPLKNGEWLTFKAGKIIKKQTYLLGLIQN
jgi:hypothetical protein